MQNGKRTLARCAYRPLDAFSLATPYDAYRYARGEAIAHPAGLKCSVAR